MANLTHHNHRNNIEKYLWLFKSIKRRCTIWRFNPPGTPSLRKLKCFREISYGYHSPIFNFLNWRLIITWLIEYRVMKLDRNRSRIITRYSIYTRITSRFFLELLILPFLKCQIYVTFCKAYQTKCKTRYGIFKLCHFPIYSLLYYGITP